MSELLTASLGRALREPLIASPPADARAWWAAHASGTFASPFESALLGGLASDRIAFAFAAGYEAALCSMLPIEGRDLPAALCATEAGPPHPRHIQTRVRRDGNALVLSGTKSFVTLAHLARSLLVFARDESGATSDKDVATPSTRASADGSAHVSTGVFVVRADAPGVSLERMPELPFVPEIPHASVRFEEVRLDEGARVTGDGWLDFVRPFRTVEDTFVHVGLLGYVLRLARLHRAPPGVIESCIQQASALWTVADGDPADAAVHVALGGSLQAAALLLERVRDWLPAGQEAERLARDAPLVRVASKARAIRLAKAGDALGLPPLDAPAGTQ